MDADFLCSPGACLVKCKLLLCVTKEGSGCLCRCPLLTCECLIPPRTPASSSILASCHSKHSLALKYFAALYNTPCALVCPARGLGRWVFLVNSTCPPACSPAILLSSAQVFPLPGSLLSSPWPALDNPPLGSHTDSAIFNDLFAHLPPPLDFKVNAGSALDSKYPFST